MSTAQFDPLVAYTLVDGHGDVGGSRRYRRKPLPSGQDLDMVVEEISCGSCVFSTTASAPDAWSGRALHGGVCTTLLDFAMAAAVQSTIGPLATFHVVRFGIDIKQDGVSPQGRIEARAHAHPRGRGSVEARGTVVDRWGTIRAEATMLVLTSHPWEGC